MSDESVSEWIGLCDSFDDFDDFDDSDGCIEVVDLEIPVWGLIFWTSLVKEFSRS